VRRDHCLPSATRISNALFIGGIADANELSESNPHSIQTVITLCYEPVNRRSEYIRYLQFPLRDDKPIRVAWLNAILNAIEDSIPRGHVLLQCGAGLSRAPSVAAAFLDRMGFMSFEDALRFVARRRPVIAPSKVLVQSIANNLEGFSKKERKA